MKADHHALKLLLPQYLAAIGCEVRQSGCHLQTRCPLHEDRTPSFSADLKPDGWVWSCFPCGAGGDVFSLHARLHGLETRTHFREVCEGVTSIVGGVGDLSTLVTRSRLVLSGGSHEDESKCIPADELVKLTTPWRDTLASGRATFGLVREFREIGSDVLKALAEPALDALGVCPASHTLTSKAGRSYPLPSPCWAYIGDGGYAVRRPFGRDSEPRFWRVGQLRRPWRSHRLPDPSVTIAHLVESESDAMALIAAGFETKSSAVCAVPGASGFRDEWGMMFAGREVHLWPDRDTAGRRFADRVGKALCGKASRVSVHQLQDWQEVAA